MQQQQQVDLDLAALSERCRQLAYPGIESCVSENNRCLNGCSGRGQCVAGFCHCKPGFFGTDCALSMGPDGKPALLADRGYVPRTRGPRVYMYELPPSMNTWRNELRLDRPTTRYFVERLVATGARVGDGDSADWYLIPITLRRSSDAWNMEKAVQYVRDTYPWWNRTQGHRHFVIATGDMGRIESERGRLSENVTFVTHWGLHADKPFSGWRASHRNATDIVLPVFLGPSKLSRMGIFTSRNHPKFATKAKPALRERNGPTFFFAGRICGDHSRPRTDGNWPHCQTQRSMGYSDGTRQLVHFHHWNRTGYFVAVGDSEYGKHLLTSKYCFGPTGGGHGQRQVGDPGGVAAVVSGVARSWGSVEDMQAALAGCVPVVISDNVLEAFEPFIDWNSFGVRLAEADIPRLHTVLDSIGPQEYARKVERLRCAAQHMAFSSITGAYMGEDGRYDAYETTLEILRAKAAHPDVPPEALRKVDPQLDAFLDCRDYTDSNPGSDSDSDSDSDSSMDSTSEDSAPDSASSAGSSAAEEVSTAEAAAAAAAGEHDASSNGADGDDAASTSAWRQHQQRQQQLQSESGDDDSNGNNGQLSQTVAQRLCSVSPFDVNDPHTPTCRQLSPRKGGPLYGGLMCIRQPTDLVACPRPWK
ncbi:hypothetical protein PLESTF_000427100 [Pleodorina starrii]|nr:hypothetical protein PLESTF_000427100 [Pleodorina starrii]